MNEKFLIAAFCSLAAWMASAEEFSFVRMVRPGDHFQCRIAVSQSVRFEFKMPGCEDPVVKLETVQAEFHGYATVRTVNASGNPVRLSLRADRFSGALNGRPVKVSLPPGTWLEADLSGDTARFTVDGKASASETEVLFRVLFPPASGFTLADLTGSKRVLPKPGGAWKPDLTAFLKMLKNRKITGLSPAAFKCGITYYGPDRLGKTECRKFGLLIETVRLTDYDCRFRFTLWLPSSGPPLRVVREATEIIRRVLRSAPPFAAGTQVEQLSEDRTEQTFFPVKKIPPPASAKKNSGDWNFLLH